MIIKAIIQTTDKPDTDVVTAKRGDILDVVPEEFVGGRVERRRHLIIRVDVGTLMTKAEHRIALRLEQWSDGRLWVDPINEAAIIVRKRRYAIPWDELVTKAQSVLGVTIDINRLLDENDEYQPLENLSFPVAALVHDRAQNKKLAAADFAAIRGAIG